MTAPQEVRAAAAGTASWSLGWRWVLHSLALSSSLVAVVALVVGVHDALIAPALVPRLVGLLLALCAVALLIAALLVFRHALAVTHRTEHLWFVPVLFLAGAVPGLLFLILQISAFVFFDWRRTLVGAVAFLIPVAAVIAVLRASQGAEAHRVWGRVWESQQTPTAKALAGFLSASLVVAAGQTLLSYYAPVKRGDSLSVSTNLVPAQQHLTGVKKGGDVQALHGTVSIENSGDAKLFFLGGIYLVTGETVPLRSGEAQAELLQKTLPKEIADPRWTNNPIGVGRYEAEPKISLVKTGLFYDPGTSWIAPNTKVELHFLAYAPKKQFTRYIATVQLIAARADRLELEAPPLSEAAVPSQVAGMASVIVTRKIVEPSWVNLVTRGTRYLYIDYSVPTDRILTEQGATWPGATVCIAYKISQCSDKKARRRIQRWRGTYGVNLFPAWYSLEMPAKS